MVRHCCTILPTHILTHMANDPAYRDAALKTLAATQRLLGRRDVQGTSQSPVVDRMGQEYRQIFDCQGTEYLPGRLTWREGMPIPGDPETAEAIAYADATYGFYASVFGRQSIDGHGMRLISSLRYSNRFDNAYWDGRQMVYGSGDGVLFGRFTRSADVIGHEMTHGVTQYTAGLIYQGQPGALNESISDVFGSMIKQHHLGQDSLQADWLIGAELFAPGVKARALRDMANPGTAYDDPRLGKDPQPAHMKDYLRTEADNGGVHLNSGIANRAFTLACKAVGGKAWEGPGVAWYRAMLTLGNPQADFATFATATVRTSAELFGLGHKVTQAILDGWHAVGVL